MKYSCRFFCVLAIGAVLATNTATLAQQSSNTPVAPTQAQAPSPTASSQRLADPSQAPAQSTATPKPILVVCAHTDIPDQGAPTLDLVDLEQYFVNQLIQRRIENVIPSVTANIPNPPAPNMYILDLSVKTMHPAVRSVWDAPSHMYEDREIFDVELSLAVTHRQSGHDLGTTGARYEHWFTNHYESQQVTEKRVAIYTAANELADRFTQEATAGRFSEALRSIQAPLPSFWDRLANGDKNAVGEALVLGLLALIAVLILVTIIATICGAIRRSFQHTSRHRPFACPVPPPPPARPQPNYAAWDQELQEAFALSFETNGFDDAACRAVAAARRDEILASHASIEAKEAERILSTKSRDTERDKKAAYAISRCDLDKTDVTETLRGAEEWPYRVLKEAKNLSAEVSQND